MTFDAPFQMVDTDRTFTQWTVFGIFRKSQSRTFLTIYYSARPQNPVSPSPNVIFRQL